MTRSETSRASPDSVSQLIKLLAEERKTFTSVEIAETLWLAMQIEPAAQVDQTDPVPEQTSSSSTIVSKPDLEDPDLSLPPLPAPVPKVDIAAPIPEVGVLPPHALPVWLADPAMLTDALSIIRALKPLLQKVAAGTSNRLDEAATVNNIARTQLVLPILEPEQEPWFDIVLVVDRGSSMHIWQRLVKDVVRILRCYGAFRDVQVFDLEVNQAAQPPKDNAVQLISKPHRPSHRPSELIDQQGRRIIIVLSDCAGKYWWDGTLLPMLQAWGNIMPTVIWQMLPAWMWKRTALGRGTAVAISNDIPGVANQRLKTQIQERGAAEGKDRLTVPVVTSEVRDLARWSLMVAGDRREVIPGFLLPQRGGTVPRSRGIDEIARDRAQQTLGVGSENASEAAVDQALDAIAHERVQRFLELASPLAQRLIMLLAAAPVITLPIMRLIRDAMLYESSSPLPVAEVFLSGLLLRLSGQEDRELERVLHEESERVQVKLDQQTSAQSEEGELEQVQLERQDLVQYDFAPRVRTILLKVLPAVDTIEVINSVSAAVERRWNQFSTEDFQAFLTNPNVEEPAALAGLRSFASVTAEILEPLGEAYADFVQRLKYGAGESSPPDQPRLEEDDFPLEDLEYEVAKLLNFPALQPCEYESATITAILDRFDFETATLERAARRQKSRQPVIQRRSAAAWGYTEPLGNATQPFAKVSRDVLSQMGGEYADLNFSADIPLDILDFSADIALDMMFISGGSFTMGAPKSEPESGDDERPQHKVNLQPFYLGRYPVTQAQWKVVAGCDRIAQDLDPDPSSFKGDNRPVENVSWDDAQEFCQRLSAQTGKDYRLPSEAQWEYACRAGTKTPFHFGETIAPDLANYDATETYNDSPKGEWRQNTTDVGSFPANEWGLHDLHGNVWEWCEDDWHDSYEDAPSDGRAWVESDRTETSRLLRGGSWVFNPLNCRSAFRYFNSRDRRDFNVGFRVCCVPPRLSS